MNMFDVRVARIAQEAEKILSFELASMDGKALPRFTAGAHIDVSVAPGLVRQYSLCNHPDEQHLYRIAVLCEPQSRGGSRAMHDQVHEGDVLSISGPKNHFPLVAAPQ